MLSFLLCNTTNASMNLSMRLYFHFSCFLEIPSLFSYILSIVLPSLHTNDLFTNSSSSCSAILDTPSSPFLVGIFYRDAIVSITWEDTPVTFDFSSLSWWFLFLSSDGGVIVLAPYPTLPLVEFNYPCCQHNPSLNVFSSLPCGIIQGIHGSFVILSCLINL